METIHPKACEYSHLSTLLVTFQAMETDEVTALVGYRSNSFIDFQSTPSKPVMDFALKITVKLFTQKQFIDQRRLPSSMRAIIATTIMMMMISDDNDQP